MNRLIDKYRILLFFVFISISGYPQEEDSNFTKDEDFEMKELSGEGAGPLEIVNIRDTLIILFEGTECGEWGGHKEKIFLQRQDDNKIIARILIDKVPCYDLVERNGVEILNPEKRTVVVDYTKTLEDKDEQLFNDFLQHLMTLYLKPFVAGNFGSNYIVMNTDKSFYLRFWNSGNEEETNYQALKRNVFGELGETPVGNK